MVGARKTPPGNGAGRELVERALLFLATAALFLASFGAAGGAAANAATGVPAPGTIDEGGYLTPQAGSSPHGGYASSTNKCKVCHAVHGAAAGGEVLLRTTNIYHNDPKYLNNSWEADCRWCHSSSPVIGADIWGTPAPPYPANSPLEDNVSMSCVYCHISGPFAIIKVYDGDPNNYWMESVAQDFQNNHASSHAMGQGGLSPTRVYQGCPSCHSVHGANTWDPDTSDANPATFILRDSPGPSLAAPVTNMTDFCRDCHDGTNQNGATGWCGGMCHKGSLYDPDGIRPQLRKIGLVTESPQRNGVSHIMTTTLTNEAGQNVALVGSEDCRSCHRGGDGTAGNSWPHLTGGISFLMDSYVQSTHLDKVCLSCHDDGVPDGAFGVGDSY